MPSSSAWLMLVDVEVSVLEDLLCTGKVRNACRKMIAMINGTNVMPPSTYTKRNQENEFIEP